MVVASLSLLHRSVRLRVLARDLRLASFLRIGGHVAGRRRRFVVGCPAGGYAGEGTEGEGRVALLGEGGAAEGHDGGLGDDGDGLRLHLWWRCFVWRIGWVERACLLACLLEFGNERTQEEERLGLLGLESICDWDHMGCDHYVIVVLAMLG